MKTLGGVLFIKDGVLFDYCFAESIKCLCELCDEVSVVEVGSSDGTIDILNNIASINNNLIVTNIPKEDWDSRKGKERISFYQNLALGMLSTDYYYLQQADEITSEVCFPAIRKIIEMDAEAFLVSRINLWRDCNSYLVVPGNRQPCSTQVIRLAKTKYKSVDDGESIDAPAVVDFVNYVMIYHYGFVRKREVMKSKVINMQEQVFELGFHDPKLDGSDIFNSELWFSGEDLQPLAKSHPKFIKDWIINRP